MKYFVLPNLASHETETIETENLYQLVHNLDEGRWTRVPENIVAGGKPAFSIWATSPTTEACFFSVIEGANPDLRVSESNPPKYIHGMIGDYDADLSNTEIATILERCHPNCKPAFIYRTFSNHVRIVWIFKTPIPYFNAQFWKFFAQKFIKEAHVKRLLPGFDDASWKDSQLFALGGEWVRVAAEGEYPSENLLMLWVEQASKKVKWKFGSDATVPMDKLAEEVELRFPGRWKGPFEVGARGCRFWDATASNDTAAIVRETGMQCFTGDSPFVPWWEIFTKEFVKQFEADRIGQAVNEIYFDGNKYWMKDTEGLWVSYLKQDISMHIRVTLGLKGAKDGEEHSEVERALTTIQLTRRIDGAVPLPGLPEDLNFYGSLKLLNTLRSRPVVPVGGVLTPDQLRADCKFILGLLLRVLGEKQFWYFIAWLKRFWMSHYERKPLPGQAIVLAGTIAIGKTFLSNVILGRLLGGYSDGTDYLLGRVSFNKEMAGVPLICVDDSTPTSNPNYAAFFTSMLKRAVANHSLTYSAKYVDTFILPNNSRTFITCNADPESLRILPDTDQNVLDKVMILLAEQPKGGQQPKFPANAAQIVNKELPYFARYLFELEIPPQYLEDSRFGVKSYHHPDLLDTARSTNASHSFKELLDIFIQSYFSNSPDQQVWEGSSTRMLQEMFLDEGLKEIAKQHKPVAVGRFLGQLMGQKFPISQTRGASRAWVIGREYLKTL